MLELNSVLILFGALNGAESAGWQPLSLGRITGQTLYVHTILLQLLLHSEQISGKDKQWGEQDCLMPPNAEDSLPEVLPLTPPCTACLPV